MDRAADWWRRAVFYQIYPRSFADASGDGVGDLAGIAARLPWLADLGIDALWLSPVFVSPMADYGYDVADYRAIDPLFGDLDGFDRLVEAAHAHGLKLIIDQVWSHSSDRHPWFRASAARAQGFDDWYVWADARPDGTPPNNWQASFGGPAWTWHPGRRQYYLHNFLASQPDLNFHHPAVQDAILDIARFWLDRGVDGFRLDVINYLAHDPALTDNPPRPFARTPAATIQFQWQRHNKSQPEALAFVARLRALLDRYGDRMAVGEIFDDDMLARQRDYTGPGRLHTAYSFHLLHARAATPALFEAAHRAWDCADGWPSWSLSNHDVPRFPSRLAGDDPRRVRALLLLLLCLRGTPFLYQGDELGLPQAQLPFDRLRDPYAIASWTEDAADAGRDGARTPMVWTDAEGGGFSPPGAAPPWLPVDPRHLPLAARVQEADPASMLHFTRRMLALRRAWPALQTGSQHPLPAPEGVLAFERRGEGTRLLCAVELAGRPARLELPPGAALLDTGLAARLEGGALALPPWAAALVTLPAEPG